MAARPIGEALRASCVARGAGTAIIAPTDGVELSFGQLAVLAERLAALTDGGAATIALITSSRVAQAALVPAGLMVGCVMCPINPAAAPEIQQRLLTHAKPKLIIHDGAMPAPMVGSARTVHTSELLHALGELPSRSATSAPVPASGGLLMHTSGSTGDPKGVLLSERAIGANVAFAVEHFGYDEQWTAGSVLPLFHTFSVISDLLPMLITGGRVVVTPGFALADLPSSATALVAHEVRSYSGVPIVFDMMMALRVPLPSSMRFAIAGAAPLTETTRTRYQRTFGHPIVPCYGLTETTCFATASAPDATKASAVGRAAGIEVAILDDYGAQLAPGVTGEIAHRGPSVIERYYGDDGKYAASFTADGWFLSGDVGHLDQDGFLFITGRKKNMLIRGGEKVYLEDVDRCLATHPAVADSCTIRVGGQRHEEQAVSFIVPRGGAGATVDAASINAHVTQALGLIARLDDVVACTEVPRSATGKVLREVLVARYAEGRGAAR
ncbi:MAG: acyl--CoA ligase [Deltaproteobacteria bacterium]|nr:acyl--CoA ligase [Deltaproteobacteria bacterium]